MLYLQREQAIKNKEVFISMIVPAFNEESGIAEFVIKLNELLQRLTTRWEIIVIDDGSSDKTLDKLLGLSHLDALKMIRFSRNFGKETALMAGLKHCSGEVAILMDADFQHPLTLLPEFLHKWQEGYDMVYGERQNRDAETPLKRNLAHLFYWIMGKITKMDMPSYAGDFRLLDRKVINALNLFPERTRFMKGLYAWVGYHKIGIPYQVKKRRKGKSGWGFSKLTELAITGITSFSDVPLRVWSLIGFIISLLSLIYAIFIIASTLIYGTDLPGFPTLAVAIMFFGGIQLLSIGILGEYIARIFTEVKRRPNYIIDFMKGFD